MSLPADSNLLERNLRALARTSPAAARAVAEATSRADAEFLETRDDVPTCRIQVEGKARLLASARHPLREADRLAEQADPLAAALFAVPGFGLGYHVEAIASRVGQAGLVFCFEPDAGLLRAVLERVDHAELFAAGNVVVLHQAESSDAISSGVRGLEGVLALGVRFLNHPPSSGRLGEEGERFCKRLVEVISATKTSVVTKLVQTEKTLQNTLTNAWTYASNPGINDLADALSGAPAIVVSAGPSLAESFEELARPGVRDRACIIAAQTVLKPLLERGIKPHFVTALDHHDISRRFYEGLTASDVEGITLVAEPKANPAILRAWPGAVRMPADEVLDRVLGDSSHAKLQGGATVAHLSYYLARYLGCDPVVLVGQDLAYTDGLYYGAGAAIHGVWAGELGEFRTLEMMEAERLGRARRMLRQAIDREGLPIATDEQLHTYLLQFEHAFAEDEEQGRMVIDAGRGAAKAHTTPMALDEAIDRYGQPVSLPPHPQVESAAALVNRALESAASTCDTLATLSRRAEEMVRSLDAFGDAQEMNEQVREIHAVRDEAQGLQPAFWLTHLLNQTGGLRRAKRDRAIAIQFEGADERDVQSQRIERDAENLAWLADAADRMASLLRSTEDGHGKPQVCSMSEDVQGRLPALVRVDPATGGLNQDRTRGPDPSAPVIGGKSIFDVTLATLARCERVSSVTLISPDVAFATRLAERAPRGLRVDVRQASEDLDDRRRAIGAARALSPSSFRGGLASLTPHDEAFDPVSSLAIVDELDAPGALVLGGDWALLDAEITDRVAERLLVDPAARHIAFAQAPAGLAACALARPAVAEIAENPLAGPVATIGGLVSYTPHAPRPDPIAGEICVTVDPELRDLGRRLIPDSHDRLAALLPALERAAGGASATSMLVDLTRSAPQRPTHLRAVLGDEPDDDLRQRVLAFAKGATDAAITLDCERCGFTEFAQELAGELRGHGAAAVHVRTPLAWGDEELERLRRAGVDVISVDVADPHFPPPIEELLPDTARGLATPWIVPRLVRNDAMLPTLLEQYAEMIMRFGAAMIVPDPAAGAGRLAALPLPAAARRRLDREDRQTRAQSAASVGGGA
ncbi:MAG: DUF115 domain-containing protein [Phycisphaerales bacterium]|jgi:hypothetical protein